MSGTLSLTKAKRLSGDCGKAVSSPETGHHGAVWQRLLQFPPRCGRAARKIRRALLNTGWLMGARGFNAVLSLVYLAIATRTLGLRGSASSSWW